MKKFVSFLLVLFLVARVGVYAQDTVKQDTVKPEGYKFTDIKRLPATSVKDQFRSGTCWAWSTASFLESEMMRLGKDSVNLSAIYFVKHAYSDKADKYVRLHGVLNFAVGGASSDVINMAKKYGIVPLEVFEGLNYGEPNHVFGEIDAVLKAYVEAVVENNNRRLSSAWKKGFDAILDVYLGEEPEKFEYKGKEYTPRTFADEVVGLNMDDYVNLSSFTHHPFYTEFALEVADNWGWDKVYNIPLNELMRVMESAIDNGYTFVWGADVSEKGFASKDAGVAVVPTTNTKEMTGAEIAKWEKLSKEQQTMEAFKLAPAPEKKITQEMRQEEFDRYLTTDDHGMHVIGKAMDQNGTPYFIVKNSWNKYNKFGGYFYASYPYMALKTMDILVHKNAIPKDIRKKLGI
ncbi:aminopeptidase C [Butyricimonas synergistica]|uniref:aminopeptidase C n=1 Tax=Butyricimonas synergistica TaxID=544644 RepID=UPI0003635AFC|nr:C1 family peptidase [Butyricimonas synergistica]